MSAIDDVFATLRAAQRKAFIPFVTAGDPDLAFTARVLETLAAHGADICEVGIPYSDPIADGPVIQASYTRALKRGIRMAATLEMLRETAPRLTTPTVTMVSFAIVHRYGAERYLEAARAAGVSGAIVPDLPVEEAHALHQLCRQRDFNLIQLVTPTTPRERAIRIAEMSTGFLYYVSVTGITGERTELPADLVDNVRWLRERTELPICIGFGISQPEHVQLLAPVADGLIVGSAIVKRMEQCGVADEADVLAEIGQYVRSMKGAMQTA